MIMLANDRELMGRLRNSALLNRVAVAIVAFVSICGAAYGIDSFLQTTISSDDRRRAHRLPRARPAGRRQGTPCPRAPLSANATRALWALRIFVLVVSAMVIYTFAAQL